MRLAEEKKNMKMLEGKEELDVDVRTRIRSGRGSRVITLTDRSRRSHRHLSQTPQSLQ